MRLANQNRACEPQRIVQRERRFRGWIVQRESVRTVVSKNAAALKVSRRGPVLWTKFFASGRPCSASESLSARADCSHSNCRQGAVDASIFV